jgi:ABC-type multidrug transport system ATPase subunit
VIEIRKLSRSFGNLIAVNNLDLDVGNEIFGLLGPNGAGKSTTVMMLTTLLKPSSGTAKVCGYDVVRESKQVRSKISYVPQDMAVDRKLTGRENVQFYAKLYGIPDRNISDFFIPSILSIKIRECIHLYSVKESVNVKMTTEIIYASRFILIGLQKRQQK